MRSISKSYKQLNEQQMMMGKKTYHYPFRKQTQGPIQDQGHSPVEPPKQQGMPSEIQGPSGLPVTLQEQSVAMINKMGMAQVPTDQIPQQGQTNKPLQSVPSIKNIKEIMNKIKSRGQPKR